MEEAQETERWIGYVDWRSRPALRGKNGGLFAASFVLAVEVLENLAFLANASNLVTYMGGSMHYSPSRAATTTTNFMGTAFLLALLGGFLSDAFFTTFTIYLLSAALEFLGLIILTVQARSSSLKPPYCNSAIEKCKELSGSKAAMFYGGLYLAALGVGGIKGSLPSHGAEQFDHDTPQGRKLRSTFFNYFIFCLSFGGLIAVTFVVWLEDNKGWQWGFGVSTIAIFVSVLIFLAGSATYRNKIPSGSPLVTIAKVILASLLNARITAQANPSNAVVDRAPSPLPEENQTKEDQMIACDREAPSMELKCLNRAAEGRPVHKFFVCTIREVEEVKVVLKVVPIFLSTIMLSCCLAQLSSFSVEQAATMDTRVGGLNVPAASLPVFPVIFIMILAPIYDHAIVPFARRVTKSEIGITHLQRIGFGLLLSILAMVVAALVEVKRKRVAREHGMLETAKPLPISFFWIAFQYLFLGSADLFTLAGLLEFFFTEAPAGMRSLATALSWASLAVGYYLSSVLVNVVNGVTGRGDHRAWLKGDNLNYYHLEKFYWLMVVLSSINFINYLFWAMKYKYRSVGAK